MSNYKNINRIILNTLLCGMLSLPVAFAQAITLEVHNPGSPGDLDPEDWSSSDAPGSFFDLTANGDINITSFSAYSNAANDGSPGDPYTIQVWTKLGTYVGSETTAGDWTLLESFSGNDTDDLTMEVLALSASLDMTSGQTMGFAVIATIGGIQWYDTCGGSDTYSEGLLTLDIFSERGMDDGFNATDSCRSFAGLVEFSLSPPEPEPEPATAVPTMSAYGLALTMLGLMFVAVRRLRASAKRD